MIASELNGTHLGKKIKVRGIDAGILDELSFVRNKASETLYERVSSEILVNATVWDSFGTRTMTMQFEDDVEVSA